MPSLEPQKVYLGTPGISSSPTTAYTVPAGKRLIMKHVRITNNSAAAATFSMITGTNMFGPPIFYFANAITIKANDVVLFDLNEVLVTGEGIVLIQGTAAALTVQISGVEVTL